TIQRHNINRACRFDSARHNTLMRHILLLSACLIAASVDAQEFREVRLDTLDLKQVAQGWGSPQKNKSVDKKPISLAGREFEHGFGTHAGSRPALDLVR